MWSSNGASKCAPVKKFTIRKNHKFGLTENTKKMIRERDQKRKRVSNAPAEKNEPLQQRRRSDAVITGQCGN